jgi:hypothetical protein
MKIRWLRDERGVALPMALMMLVLLTTLMLAFAVLSQSEPVIAANHLRVSQARSLAESGFEHAVWALSQGSIASEAGTPLPAGALAVPLPAPTPAPFNGLVFTTMGTTGGYVVTVTTPDPVGKPEQRLITSTGWTPTNDAANLVTKAHRTIQATVERLPDIASNVPCALCVKGDVGVGGNSLIDSTLDTSCGNKKGTYSAGNLDLSGSAEIKGADGNTAANEPTDYTANADPASFDAFSFNQRNIELLKKLAKANKTYFGPGFSGVTNTNGEAVAGTYSGGMSFNSGNKIKNGVVFIDTISGSPLGSPANPADFGSLDIHGNPFVAGDFAGWIFINGSIAISGNMKINGLVYAMNDITYNGTGTGEINGLAISENVYDITATSISSSDDSLTKGNSRIKFNCANTRQPAQLPMGFTLVPGTYREMAD